MKNLLSILIVTAILLPSAPAGLPDGMITTSKFGLSGRRGDDLLTPGVPLKRQTFQIRTKKNGFKFQFITENDFNLADQHAIRGAWGRRISKTRVTNFGQNVTAAFRGLRGLFGGQVSRPLTPSVDGEAFNLNTDEDVFTISTKLNRRGKSHVREGRTVKVTHRLQTTSQGAPTKSDRIKVVADFK